MIHWYYFFPFCIFCNVGVCVCLLCYSFEWFTLTHSLNHSLGAIKSQRDNIKALNTEYFVDVWMNRQVHSHSIDISFPWRIFLNYFFFLATKREMIEHFCYAKFDFLSLKDESKRGNFQTDFYSIGTIASVHSWCTHVYTKT